MTALAITIGVVSVGTLLLWYLPVLFGYHSPYDGLFFVAWLVLVAFLTVFWFLKKSSSERLQRTAYLDFAHSVGYSQMGGSFSFISREDLMDKLVAQCSRKLPAIPRIEEPPEGFAPSAVVNTYKFLARVGPQTALPLVEEWQGDVQVFCSGNGCKMHLFNSEMQLESILDSL